MGFERLRVYQAAERLDAEVEALVRPITAIRHARDVDQARRACASISYNIAEAYGSGTDGRKVYHLRVARGSADETRAILRRLVARRALPPERILQANALTVTIAKMLSSWIDHLSS